MAGHSFIDIHTHRRNTIDAISVVNMVVGKDEEPTGLFSAGIHPWFATNWQNNLAELKKLLAHPSCIMLGECGLDTLAETEPEIQERVFREQVRIARQTKKPLIIHCVRSHDRVLAILKEENSVVPAIIHGFNNKIPTGEKCLDAGLYLSFGAAILNESAAAAVMLKQTPSEKFLLETDDSEAKIEEIYAAAATIRKITLEALQEQIWLNFNNIFDE